MYYFRTGSPWKNLKHEFVKRVVFLLHCELNKNLFLYGLITESFACCASMAFSQFYKIVKFEKKFAWVSPLEHILLRNKYRHRINATTFIDIVQYFYSAVNVSYTPSIGWTENLELIGWIISKGIAELYNLVWAPDKVHISEKLYVWHDEKEKWQLMGLLFSLYFIRSLQNQ